MAGPVFAWPLRPRGAAYVSAGYLDPEYERRFGVPHTGEDWNLRSGGDSDLGYPVQAVFPGRVVAAGHYPVWGNLVVVEVDPWVQARVAKALGEALEGLYVRYAHLQHLVVAEGERVEAGECLGSIGKGDQNRYLAHLHLDLPRVALPPNAYPKTRREVLAQYLDPGRVWAALVFADRPNLLPQGLLYTPARRAFVQEGEGAGLLLRQVGEKLYLRPSDPKAVEP